MPIIKCTDEQAYLMELCLEENFLRLNVQMEK